MAEFENPDFNLLFPELMGIKMVGDPAISEPPSPTSSSDERQNEAMVHHPHLQSEFPSGTLLVLVQHKPRGCKGIWQNIENGQKIRVTKDKGKRLRLEIQMNADKDKYRTDQLQAVLYDIENGHIALSNPGDFSIESSKVDHHTIAVEVKLYKSFCKRLQFVVTMPILNGGLARGISKEFAAHNSGSTITKNKDETESSSPSPPGTLSAVPPEYGMMNGNWLPPVQNPRLPPQYNYVHHAPPSTQDVKRQRVENSTPIPMTPVTVVPGDLDVQGVVRARAFMQFSDLRLKTNITDIVDALDIVTKLKGKKYEWKPEVIGEQNGGKKVIGLIAQEVQKVVPEVVHTDPFTGYLSVSYAELLPIILEAFNQFLSEYKTEKIEANQQVNALQQEIGQLSKNLDYNLKKNDYEFDNVLTHIALLSHDLFNTKQAQQSLLTKQLMMEKKLNEKEQSPFEKHGKFYYYLTLLFSIFLIGTIVGIVLISISGQPYDTIHHDIEKSSASVLTYELEDRGDKPDKNKTTSNATGNHNDSSSTTSYITTSGDNSNILDDNLLYTEEKKLNQLFVLGVILLGVGIIGMTSTVSIGGYVYKSQKRKKKDENFNMNFVM